MDNHSIGSNVMVVTLQTSAKSDNDAAMEFVLQFPKKAEILKKRGDFNGNKVTMNAGPGTVSLLDPVDDLTATHGASFAQEVKERLQWTGWRVALAYRWLQGEEDFYDDTGGLRMTKSKIAMFPKSNSANTRSDEVLPRIKSHEKGFGKELESCSLEARKERAKEAKKKAEAQVKKDKEKRKKAWEDEQRKKASKSEKESRKKTPTKTAGGKFGRDGTVRDL
ncbi:hypothetical protein TrCOL_g7353 [Triparma columacea]|uniref:Uncharacterized protein n=1 Tax=Triparma columacea TaxID=722753 RepID=A0A9W7L1D9_9STRA|nr:hypothetical protein TrCOL_g7353 [Triparma columacea]